MKTAANCVIMQNNGKISNYYCEVLMENQNSVDVKLTFSPVVNYALHQNRIPSIREITVFNNTDKPLSDITIRLSSSPPIIGEISRTIAEIEAESAFILDGLDVKIDAEKLAALTERIAGNLTLEVMSSTGEILHKQDFDITFLAFDEWQGSLYYPEVLTAFITPNHERISGIISAAARLLAEWGEDPSLNAYQTQNPNRVLMQAAAVYGALQRENIVYCVPPASFEKIGQRIRLCDAVLDQKLGTCLDLTLLYAACLEAIGLNPLLILQDGHIFAGLWLEDMTFAEAVSDDPSLITKRIADGVNEIAVVECTSLTAGKSVDFDGARAFAIANLNNTESFRCIIDVARARMSQIRPLPLRIKGDSGFAVKAPERPEEEITRAPKDITVIHVGENTESVPTGKLAVWERKLLDLSLRNSLINLRITRSAIPLLTHSINELEDAVSTGEEFGIKHIPSEITLKNENDFAEIANMEAYDELLKSEFKSRRLRSSLSEGELARSVVQLYRSSRTSMEENGANTLYLALGLLRWYETKISEKARYAPILLIPVEIIRKSANKGYIIRLRDEEPQINITLLEKLKQEYGIVISGLETLAQDDFGIDTRGIFATIRRAVMDQPHWDVVESALLGTFTFSQFVMWNDIKNRSDDLARNSIVKSLIDGRLSWAPEAAAFGENPESDDVLLPVPTDATQLYAIKLALAGESFVLHGPPGTGKSQTITTIIANALANGKSVLFAAEKMAALSVVQKRMEKIGLAPFCLEVHSNKAKKSDILEHLRITSELAKATPSQNYDEKAAQLAQKRKELDAYVKALHEKQGFGLSVFEAINSYELYHQSPDAMAFPIDESPDSDLLSRRDMQVSQIIAAAKAVGHPHSHAFSAIGCTEYSFALKSELPRLVADYRGAAERVIVSAQPLSQRLGTDSPALLKDYSWLDKVSAQLDKWLGYPESWAQYGAFPQSEKSFTALKEMALHLAKAALIKEKLMKSWNADFLRQDGKNLLEAWKQAQIKWFLPKLFAENKVVKLVSFYSLKKVNKAELFADLTALVDYQNEFSLGSEILQGYRPDLGALDNGEETDWQAVYELAQSAEKSAAALDKLLGADKRGKVAGKNEISEEIKLYLTDYQGFADTQKKLYDALKISENPDATLAAEQKLCDSIDESPSAIKEWTVWNYACEQGEKLGLTPFIAAYKNGLPHEQAYPAYKKAVFKALVLNSVNKSEALNRFSGVLFNDSIKLFKRMEKEASELSKQEIYCRLAARIPDFTTEAASNSELGILQRAIRSKGRGTSIRSLFEKIPNLLSRLCPCMLMSPISAAQYLDPKTTPFDIVIFDEASQMPTARAIGAIARGKSAVIVGDPKQMPPTSFFSASKIDEENFDSEDLESILDDCLALNMPQSHLLWHYRSRHESLISFSNRHFYENKLYTFPSVNDREKKITFMPIDGAFDRGKTRQNKKEAEAIVAEIIRRFHDETARQKSVGVITFNIQQQNLIDDLLSAECEKDAKLDSWVYQSAEPLFIKNLENVQGDERDVILFSIAYAPDKNGSFYMNFGPLNREGGWRRLNVAFTRAREEMHIFSSISGDSIDLSRTSAEGVAALKAFLNYAKTGYLKEYKQEKSVIAYEPDGVSEIICNFLKQHGFDTAKSVGKSGFKVDIGVVDPEKPESYLLGILLDGQSYNSAKTTRDREVAQTSVLEGLGWRTHRVWSMDWWDDSQKELDKILAAVQNAEKHGENPPAKPAADKNEIAPMKLAASVRPEQSAVKTQSVYKAAAFSASAVSADEFALPYFEPVIRDAVLQVLKTEAPICEELLTRRVVQGFGIARAGSRIQACMQAVYETLPIYVEQSFDRYIYWENEQDCKGFADFRINGDGENKRSAAEIPPREVANAVLKVLKEQIGLPEESLIRETAGLFGFSRLGNVVIPAMLDGISFALNNGMIDESKKKYFTAKV